MLLERVLARWRCLVAFLKALDLLHGAMWAIEMAIKVGKYYILVLFAVALTATKAIWSE